MPNVPELSTDDLLRRLEAGEDVQVLDVRAPHRLASGRIDVLPNDRFFNVAGSKVMAMDDPASLGIDPAKPLAVVCGHGNSSKTVTTFLGQRGFSAVSVRGGMAAWMNTAATRPLAAPAELDTLLQFDRVGKGSLAYLLVSDGEALLIDPARHTEPYDAMLNDLGAKLVGVADTHVHADYISGAPAIAAAHAVPYYLHPADNVHVYDRRPGTLPITAVADGSTISFGRATLTVMHTPGHTEGSVTYRLGDGCAFTGDFIFINSIGRPDLGGVVEEWTPQLWASLQRALTELPPSILIYPAHYATDAERNPDRTIGRALGEIRNTNEPLGITDEHEFTNWILSRQAAFPEAYRSIKAINVGLLDVTEQEAEVLEGGKNECAV